MTLSFEKKMYLRVKRARQTFFVTIKPTDNILKLKHAIALYLQKTKDPRQFRLMLPKTTKDGQHTLLESSATISSVGLVNDSVVYMVYQIEDGKLTFFIIDTGFF